MFDIRRYVTREGPDEGDERENGTHLQMEKDYLNYIEGLLKEL